MGNNLSYFIKINGLSSHSKAIAQGSFRGVGLFGLPKGRFLKGLGFSGRPMNLTKSFDMNELAKISHL